MRLLTTAIKRLRWQWGFGLLLHSVLGVTAQIEEGPPDLPADGHTTYLQFLNAPTEDRALEAPPRLALSVGGGSTHAVLDTGSTGVVISALMLPFLPKDRHPGQVVYTSSGRIMSGFWVHVPVTLSGRNGVSVTTTPMPALAVTRISCTTNARNCTPREMPKGVAMIGIGYARRDNAQIAGEGDGNPLQNLPPDAIAGARRGYVITRDGLTVGLTHPISEGFSFVKLKPDLRAQGQWRAAPMCLRLDSSPDALCGNLLVDTGVNAMFVSAPALGQVSTLPMGTRLTLTFAEEPSPRPEIGYSAIVGDPTSATSPTNVIVAPPHDQPFVNTGLHFLNVYDVLHDADNGYAGYRLHPIKVHALDSR